MKLKQESTCKNRKQMAAEYGLDPRTFVKLLKEKNILISRRVFTPAEQEMIYNALGRPLNKEEPEKPKGDSERREISGLY